MQTLNHLSISPRSTENRPRLNFLFALGGGGKGAGGAMAAQVHCGKARRYRTFEGADLVLDGPAALQALLNPAHVVRSSKVGVQRM